MHERTKQRTNTLQHFRPPPVECSRRTLSPTRVDSNQQFLHAAGGAQRSSTCSIWLSCCSRSDPTRPRSELDAPGDIAPDTTIPEEYRRPHPKSAGYVATRHIRATV